MINLEIIISNLNFATLLRLFRSGAAEGKTKMSSIILKMEFTNSPRDKHFFESEIFRSIFAKPFEVRVTKFGAKILTMFSAQALWSLE